MFFCSLIKFHMSLPVGMLNVRGCRPNGDHRVGGCVTSERGGRTDLLYNLKPTAESCMHSFRAGPRLDGALSSFPLCVCVRGGGGEVFKTYVHSPTTIIL